MDFALSAEQEMFRDLFHDFVEQEVAPLAEQIDQEEKLPDSLLQKAAAQGFLGATLPEEYGGAGLDYSTYALLAEAVGRECLSLATALGIHTMLSAMTLLDGGTPAQREAFLPRLAG